MNDRFKFRFFNEYSNKLEFCDDYDLKDIFESGNPVMQCTGLKDKNGKLIYENDIVRFYFDKDEIIAVIEWDNNESRFYLNTTDYFKDKYVTDYEIVKQEEYEIIGNIYQDSHLIEN